MGGTNVIPHDAAVLSHAAILATLPRHIRKRVLRDAITMTSQRLLVEHGMREIAKLYQEQAALALEMTATHTAVRRVAHLLPPGHQGLFVESLGLALATQQALQAHLQGHLQGVIAAVNGRGKSRWEEFDDGLALAARVLSFGLIRK